VPPDISVPITQRDDQILPAIQEILGFLLEEVRGMRRQVSELQAAWQEYEPVVSAFRRGGVLAARTAARNGRNGG